MVQLQRKRNRLKIILIRNDDSIGKQRNEDKRTHRKEI